MYSKKSGKNISKMYNACGSHSSDDILWFGQEKVGFDHKMLWFEADFGAKNEQKNDVFSSLKKG